MISTPADNVSNAYPYAVYVDNGPRLHDWFNIILRRRWLITLVMGVTTLAVYCFTLWMVPIYEATATIHVQLSGSGMPDLFQSLERESDQLRKQATQLEILKSRALAEMAVRRIGYQLQLAPPPQWLILLRYIWSRDIPYITLPRQPNIALQDIEVVENVTPARYTITFLQGGTFVVQTAKDRTEVGKGEIGQPFRSQQFAFRLESKQAQEGDEIGFALLTLPSAAMRLRTAINASAIRGTDLIMINARANTPELARDMAAALTQEYIALNLQQKTQEASQALDFIKRQLPATREALETIESQLSRFKETKKLVTLSSEVQANLTQLTQFDTTLKQIQTSLKEAEGLRRHLQTPDSSLDSRPMYALGIGPESPILVALAARLSDLMLQEQSIRVQYTPRHPNVRQVQEQIQEVKTKMMSEVSSYIANLRAREAAVQDIIQKYEAQMKTFPQAEQELANLTRQAQVNAEVYAFLLKKREETQILEASTISNVRLIDSPLVPGVPIMPKKKQNFGVAVAVGLALGIGLASFIEYLDNTIRTLEEAERQVGLPLLGAIPEVPGKGSKGRRPLVVSQPAQGRGWAAAAEEFRSLRTNLQFLDIGAAPRRKLAITSPQMGDGKTTVVVNLALSLAAMGRKTLLVDADLRKPQLATMFAVPREPGLVDALRMECRWSEVIHEVGENCHVLTAGAIPLSPSELLGSRRMREVLSEWEAAYDYVLFDVPPVVAVTDPVVMGDLCQGVLLVIRANVTSARAIQRTRSQLETARVPVVGIVMNGLKRTPGYNYNYYNYNYYYYNTNGQRSPRGRAVPGSV